LPSACCFSGTSEAQSPRSSVLGFSINRVMA